MVAILLYYVAHARDGIATAEQIAEARAFAKENQYLEVRELCNNMGAPIPISSNERIQSRTVSTPLPTATRGPDACDTQRAAQGHSGIRHYDTELPDWPETTGDTRDRTPWYAFNGTGGSQLLMTPPGDLYTCGTSYPGIDAAQSPEQTSSRSTPLQPAVKFVF